MVVIVCGPYVYNLLQIRSKGNRARRREMKGQKRENEEIKRVRGYEGRNVGGQWLIFCPVTKKARKRNSLPIS